jgi:CubicO group peptidase (beta-lactamase class C family)
MRRAFFAKLLLGGALLTGCSRSVPAVTIEGGDVGRALETIAAKHKIPAIAAVAIRGDQIIGSGVAGLRKVRSTERLTLDDQFHLGSDTKAMTATLAGLLVEEGKLKWTTTLGDVFGDTVKTMAPAWKSVTLDQLLSHRAGMPPNTDPAQRQRAFRSAPVAELRREFVADVLSHPPEYPPGSKFEYSNTGFIVLGAIIEKITGQMCDDVMQERVFKPLAITTAGFGAPGTAGKIDQPWGHREDGTPINPGSPNADNPAIYGPAGTSHMTMGDWSKFVGLHLRGDPSNPQRALTLLKAETIEHLHAADGGQGYMGGWGVLTRSWAKGKSAGATGKVLTHAGSNTMWFCAAWVAPEIDFAVLVACNQGGDAATKACDEAAGAMIREFAAK